MELCFFLRLIPFHQGSYPGIEFIVVLKYPEIYSSQKSLNCFRKWEEDLKKFGIQLSGRIVGSPMERG